MENNKNDFLTTVFQAAVKKVEEKGGSLEERLKRIVIEKPDATEGKA
jgi:hypothetical protein